MHWNQYLGMQIFKNFSEDDIPIVRCISVTLHLWYVADTYVSGQRNIIRFIAYDKCVV